MAVTPADVQALSLTGEFDALTDPQIQLLIDRAACYMNEAAWGSCYDTGVALLAAHLAYDGLKGGAGATGSVTSLEAGGIRAGFGSTGGALVGNKYAFGTSVYGKQWHELRRLLFMTPMVAIESPINSFPVIGTGGN